MLIRNHDIQTSEEWKGLAHYLAGYESLENVLFETNIPGLSFVLIGRDIVNSVQLLDSAALVDLLETLSKDFDIVLVDAPPVGLVIDSAAIAKHCDGCVMIAEYNTTKRREMRDAFRQIEQSGCPILGCVINNVKFDLIITKRYYNRCYYTHYYSKYYKKDGKRTKKSAKETC